MRVLNTISLLAVMILYSACSEIIEPDLTDKKVSLIAPQDNYSTTTVLNNFSWNELEGATKYRLQIAKPSFFLIQQMVLDTTISEASLPTR